MPILTSAELDVSVHEGQPQVLIVLNDAYAEAVFELAFDGFCPACLDNRINEGDVICCNCLQKAIQKHWSNLCCEHDIRDVLEGI